LRAAKKCPFAAKKKGYFEGKNNQISAQFSAHFFAEFGSCF